MKKNAFANIFFCLIYKKLMSCSFSCVDRCTDNDLNGTDIKGRVVLCTSLGIPPLMLFPVALKNVLDAGGSGLIFAQYTTDILDVTKNCNGTACVLVDLDTAQLISSYISGTR
jgi:hypothetical protein